MDRAEHREWIGGAIAVLLANYYQERDPDERVTAALGKQWADDLEPFPRDVIERAINGWRRYQRIRPTPADILKLCWEHMPKPREVPWLKEAEGHRERVTPEQARAILDEYGYGEIVKRIPKAGEEA